MADVKISGLPASTVPLAGTEVLPIVQSSTTKKVSIANVTAGRAVSALSFAPTGSALPVNGVFLPAANAVGLSTDSEERLRISAAGGVSIGNTTDPGATNLSVTGTANASSLIPTSAPSSKWAFDGTNSALLVTIANDATYDLAAGSGIIYAWDNGGNGVGVFYTYYGTQSLQFNPQLFYSVTQNTPLTMNMYFNGSTGYRFQNKTGSSKSLYIVTIRTRTAA